MDLLANLNYLTVIVCSVLIEGYYVKGKRLQIIHVKAKLVFVAQEPDRHI